MGLATPLRELLNPAHCPAGPLMALSVERRGGRGSGWGPAWRRQSRICSLSSPTTRGKVGLQREGDGVKMEGGCQVGAVARQP